MNNCYQVRAFYNEQGSRPGEQAIHTWNIGTVARDMEIRACRMRRDIGRYEVYDPWTNRTTSIVLERDENGKVKPDTVQRHTGDARF